ncbi:hypothetical protein ElyMa_003812800 [Elysia marginata]|uniref:Uncharacterized protein n=1 Tax=Elysia marginata TaxID=1093978 RepID=A0AAV4FF79_9GAST|nr:hypothetical protein ElyMa_003812800 [Elysia marginata]
MQTKPRRFVGYPRVSNGGHLRIIKSSVSNKGAMWCTAVPWKCRAEKAAVLETQKVRLSSCLCILLLNTPHASVRETQKRKYQAKSSHMFVHF